jgi:triosephosphate isomerase
MQKRDVLIVGNWKVNPETEKEAIALAKAAVKGTKKGVTVALATPFVYLSAVSKELKRSKIKLAAQNISVFPGGAHTGEISGTQLKNLGVEYCLVGHSERRKIGDSDSVVNEKVRAILRSGITPILCVGEDERDEKGSFASGVGEQIKNGLSGVAKAALARIVIAYEPVWAISTTANRKDATPADSLEMVLYIRKVLADMTTPQIASQVRIIYGGSANSSDANQFLTEGGVSGLLPGRASLDAKEFSKIIEIASK